MKTLLKINVMIVLLALVGCEMPEYETVEISISDDITSSNQTSSIDITADDIIKLFGVEENPFNHGKVRISTLSNVSLNKTQQAKLNPVESMAEYQELFREAEIKKFISEIDTLLHSARSVERGKQSSSLLRPMHQELNRLARSNASKRVAIFYTDVQEHSTIFSSYSKMDMQFLIEHREEFTKRVLDKAPLPENLDGITVFIINNQQDENAYHQALMDWYYELLTSRGSSVSISANLVLD